MRALEQTWQRMGFLSAPNVDRMLLHGTAAGVFAAALGAFLGALFARPSLPGLAVSLSVSLSAAALLVVLPRQRLGMRVALFFTAACFPLLVPWTVASLPFFFTVPLGLVLAREPTAPLRKLVVLIGPSLGAAWCLLLEHWLSARHLGEAAALGWVAMLGAGLFISAGSALGWLSFAIDPVEVELAPQPKVQLAWVRLRKALARLPRGEGRTQLAALVHEGAERCLRARAEREAQESAVADGLEEETREAVTALRERLEQISDPELESHLNQLLRVHRDTLEQVDGLHRKVERLEAREAADAGWLETAAFSVELAPRSELGARELTSRLRALLPR